MKKKIFTLMACAMTALTSSAQWNTAAKPSALIDCSGHGDYYVCNPLSARTTDGKTWLSYKVWETTGVHTYLQLLDKDGIKQFDGLGILVNNYQTPSWWSKYQLAVANDGSALVSVADSRSETITDNTQVSGSAFEPAIYKIGQDGSFLWGLNGVSFSKYQKAPYTDIFVNGDDVYLQFTDTSNENIGTYMNRISSDGVAAFDECKAVYGQCVPTLNGDLLVFSASGDGAQVNRINRNLESVWDSPIVYDSYSYGGHELRPYKIAIDGEGGAAVAYTRNMGDFAHNIRVQHIGADGELGFGLTGIDAYNAEEYDHDYPGIAVNKQTKEIMVDWEDQLDLYTQSIGKYTYNGDRQWGEKGIQVLSKTSTTGYAYGRVGSGALSNGDWILAVRDADGWANEKLVIMRLDKDGGIVWKKTYGRGLDISDPSFIVEEDASYLFFRGESSLDVLRVFNADGTTTGINTLESSENAVPKSYYTLDGKKLNAPQKGINLVRMSDGTARKIVIR